MIKNKDGTPYRLERPNPIREKQNVWDRAKIFSHNRFGKLVIIPDLQKSLSKIQKEIPIGPASFEEIRAEEPVQVQEDMVDVWCLPAYKKEYVDSLYNEKYVKINYGKKFIFKSVLVEMADISMVIWTATKIAEGSIIYPKVNDKRWWRVEEIKKDEKEGYLLYCIITDYQADFSE